MLVEFDRTVSVDAPLEEAWALVRDVRAVGQCVPSVTDLQTTASDTWIANLSDRVGPFRVVMPIALHLQEETSSRSLEAQLSGHDRRTQTRIEGRLLVACSPEGHKTNVRFRADVQVLGPVATLGGGPITRKTDEVFDQLVRCIIQRLAERDGKGLQAQGA